jgi:hypothetical protein
VDGPFEPNTGSRLSARAAEHLTGVAQALKDQKGGPLRGVVGEKLEAVATQHAMQCFDAAEKLVAEGRAAMHAARLDGGVVLGEEAFRPRGSDAQGRVAGLFQWGCGTNTFRSSHFADAASVRHRSRDPRCTYSIDEIEKVARMDNAKKASRMAAVWAVAGAMGTSIAHAKRLMGTPPRGIVGPISSYSPRF